MTGKMTFDSLMGQMAPRGIVSSEVDGVGLCYFRHPTMAEWHEITVAHQELGDGKAAPTDLICKTIATVLVDEEGKRVVDAVQAKKLAEGDPKVVMTLYQAAVSVAFGITDEAVEDAAGK